MDRYSGSESHWDYLNFELEIREGAPRGKPREYVVAVRSPVGEVQERMFFPFDERELEDRLQTLESALHYSGSTRRATPSREEQVVRDFGQSLFGALFVDEVRTYYEHSLSQARRQNKGLRLKLRIRAPELAVLPWEFLYDAEQDQYLSLSSTTPLVRYVELPQPLEPLPISPPLRVLGMVASPSDLAPLDLRHEKQLVEEATKELRADGMLELTWLEGQTWRHLQRALRRGPWHVFHFTGHGGFDPAREEGFIALADEAGRARMLGAASLAQLLDDHHPLRLVFLNSNEGARGSERNALSSTAATLVRRGIPAVVAMQYEITDESAIEFSRDFYEAIADGLPVDTAVTEARVALSMDSPIEWGIPVLYTRLPDGRIFGVREADEETTEEVRGRRNAIPSGTITFLFTEVEGSTALWEDYPTQMQEALARHDEIMRSTVETHGGYVFKMIGDACCVAFDSSRQALEAALAAQRALLAEAWPENAELRVRMALHTGVPEERDGDYFGPPINRVARLLSAGHGGQILLSDETYNLVRDILDYLEPGSELRDLGEHRLRDLRYTERIYQLVVPDLPSEFPPPRGEPITTQDERPGPGAQDSTPSTLRGEGKHRATGAAAGRTTAGRASRSGNIPSGTVTFLFTDIEGTTGLWESYPREMDMALGRHDDILRATVESHNGYLFKTIGDACCAAFDSARDAVLAALEAQRALFAEPWDKKCQLLVRMALHTGVPEERDGDYFGRPVNRVARLLSAGHGGQILLSDETYNLVRDILDYLEPGSELRDLGEHRLRDLRYTERIYQLVVPDLPSDFPPPRTHGPVTHDQPGTREVPQEPEHETERYHIMERLGGGMASEVYLAHDEVLDRDVAFKVLREQYASDERFVERFKSEAQHAARLAHPNIVAVYNQGKTREGAYYIVMECMTGGTLKDLVRRGPLPPARAATLALQVARALQAAHRHGVVHRNIKQQNILLSESGEAKVADFGITRAASQSAVTQEGSVLGTPHYISPEQALGRPASPQSDLYSLGVVLYEMLTGELPYDAETPVGVVMKHVSEQLRPPREVNPDVPESLNDITMRLLAKDPEARYPDADALIEELERARDRLAMPSEFRPLRTSDRLDVPDPPRLFIIYSQSNDGFRKQLQEHLYPLGRQGLIADWHDRRIGPDQKWEDVIWEDVISENLEASQIILLLVSPSLIASPYWQFGREMKRAWEKHEAGEARVIPVILRPGNWSETPLRRLQVLPRNGIPISEWSNRDEAWLDVIGGIRKAVEEFDSGRFRPSEVPEQGETPDLLRISRDEALERVHFAQGNLLEQQVDALVVSTGSEPWQFGAVGEQVVERVGSQLLQSLRNLDPLPPGEAYVTTSGTLPAQYLLFTPIEVNAGEPTPSSVARAVSAALTRAVDLGDVHAIALPAIGVGAAGLDPDDVAPLVLEAVVEHLQRNNSFERVVFVFTREKPYRAYVDAYQAIGGRLSPPWWPRLTRSSTRALRLAEAIRQHTGEDYVRPEHMLAGLYLVSGEEAEILLTTLVDNPRSRMVVLVGLTDFRDLQSIEETDPATLSVQSMATLEAAIPIADARSSEFIRARHILNGLLVVPNRAATWLSEITGQPVERLRRLLDHLPEDEQLTAAYIQSFLLQEEVVVYDVQLDLPTASVAVGEEFEVTVSLLPQGRGEGTFCSLDVTSDQASGGEIEVMLDTRALKIAGTDAANLPLVEPGTDGVPSAAWPQARFLLSAVRPGPVEIEALLYLESVFQHSLTDTVHVDEAGKRETHLTLRPRPVPSPDLVLEVKTRWSAQGSSVTFQYRLDGFGASAPAGDGLEHDSEILPQGWVEQAQGMLDVTLSGGAGGQVQDLRLRLRSLGQYLYQTVLPPELQHSLRRQGGSGRTLLIVADQAAALPWELLHDGQGFLGERFVIGRWLWELDDARPYEFPIGKVSVAHYYDVGTPEAWAELLQPASLPRRDFIVPVAPEPEVLDRGVFDLAQVEMLQGLHVIRRGAAPGAADRFDAPVRVTSEGGEEVEDEVRAAKLNLRRYRPLVSLGYLSAGRPEPTQLENIWIPTYIRAGCSAFIGPRWAVQPTAEAIFVRSFYTALWTGAALGEAFREAQNLIRKVLPESLDWLAYALVGDPMARAYRPVQGEGYAVVEPVGRQIDDPLLPGSEARFRVSLRRTPPVWHEERVIEVAEELQFERLEALVIAPGLTVTPESPIGLVRTPDRNYQGWFTLTAPQEAAEAATLVQVHFVDGRRPVHSSMFELTLTDKVGEEQ